MGTESKLRTVFAAMAIVLVVTVASTYWVGLQVLRSNDDVISHQSAITDIEEALATITDAETGQRGFLLTGNENYLAPYNDATGEIQNDLNDLRKLADKGLLPRANVEELSRLTDEKFAELKVTVETRRSQGFEDAVKLVRTGHGKELMDGVRGQGRLMLDAENKGLQEAEGFVSAKTWFRSLAFLVVGLINLAFIWWAFDRLRREIRIREAAATEVRRQRELLRVTLASIGDAVIVTDVQARVTFMNDISEQLTGWKFHEAQGQPCADIFKIINEESRAVVTSPVEKVLQSGAIVGLANHTLLIRKDGTEIPIDDSGAPIRESDGNVRGVVLVFRDFSEHKAAEQRLRDAKNGLETANKAKDQFLAALSHELRTPLTPVLATLTTWESHEHIPKELLPDVQMLRRNIELEARLIDDLLDLTRIVRGKLTLNFEQADVHELIESVAGMYQSDIHARNLKLTMDLKAVQHHVSADPARLQQVMWNVLKNATKFTSEGGAIAITTGNIDGDIQLTVKDNGIGMSAETLARIFRPFEQGDDEIVRRYGGLGLGMAISKALITAQNGMISAASDGVGRGSIFTISMPVVNPSMHRPAEETRAPRVGTRNRRQLKILLVEDHPDTALVMSRLLRRLGHEVTTSGSVASALSSIDAAPFDIMLSDIGLPDGTGIDLIRQIRQQHKIPAIALTGFGMDEDIAKCREAGFSVHLTKPVNFQKLEMVIHQLANGEDNANG